MYLAKLPARNAGDPRPFPGKQKLGKFIASSSPAL